MTMEKYVCVRYLFTDDLPTCELYLEEFMWLFVAIIFILAILHAFESWKK